MEQDETSKSWFWGWAIALLVACSGAVVGLTFFLNGQDALTNPSGAGKAVGSTIGLWALGGVAPLLAHFILKPSQQIMLKSWIAGCCVVFSLTFIGQTYGFIGDRYLPFSETETATFSGGYIFCGIKIDISKEMGPPEEWTDKARQDLIRSIFKEKRKGDNINTQNGDISTSDARQAVEEGRYFIPCATLISTDSFNAYLAKRVSIERQIRKTIHKNKGKNKDKKMMVCLYAHRKEINEQNKAAINYICNQRVNE